MAPEFSKMVLVQMNQALELVRAIQTHQNRILSQLLEHLRPYMGDFDQDNFALCMGKALEFLLMHLDHSTHIMGAADLSHTHKLLETQQAREHRERALEYTFKKVFSFKTAILAHHGEEALVMLGISGETPRMPAELERWLERVLDVAKRGITLPPPTLPTMQPWNADLIVETLTPILSQLRASLDQVSQKQHDEKDTLTRKWQLMEHHNYIYTSMASISESCAHLVGEHDLGDRLRPRTNTRPRSKKGKGNTDNAGNKSSKQPVSSTPGNGPASSPSSEAPHDTTTVSPGSSNASPVAHETPPKLSA